MASELQACGVAVVDGFLGAEAGGRLRDEVLSLRKDGAMTPGMVGGGATGDDHPFANRAARGDLTAFAGPGSELWRRCGSLQVLVDRAEGALKELQTLMPEMRRIDERSELMIAWLVPLCPRRVLCLLTAGG